MNKMIFFLLCITTTIVNNSCTKCNEPNINNCNNYEGLVRIPDQLPEFPGGASQLNLFIASNLIYPEKSKNDKIEGNSVISFIINKYGHIECIQIVRSLNSECDNEAIRIINIMPNWIPGRYNNQPVSIAFKIAILFKL